MRQTCAEVEFVAVCVTGEAEAGHCAGSRAAVRDCTRCHHSRGGPRAL